MASGAAKGFITLALPRMFIGVGESIITPTSMSLLGDAFPPKRMGFAAGFYYLGVPLGVAISLLLVGFVADIKSPIFLEGLLGETIGWRGCFYMLGILGFLTYKNIHATQSFLQVSLLKKLEILYPQQIQPIKDLSQRPKELLSNKIQQQTPSFLAGTHRPRETLMLGL